MPIFSDLSNISHYYGGGTSSLNYLSGPYAGHSSIVAANYRAPPSPSFVKPSSRVLVNRAYKPHLATISENQITRSGINRLNSPKLLYHKSQKYVRYQKPISINTSDIDVSSNRYRRSFEPSVTKSSYASPSTPERSHSYKENKDDEDSANAFMPRIDKSSRSTIKRDRTLVRLHTSRADEANEDDKNFETMKIFDEEIRVFKPKWRDNFEPEELSPKQRKADKNEPLSAKFKEKFTIKDKNDDISNNISNDLVEDVLPEATISRNSASRQTIKKVPSFHDLCRTISSESIEEDLNPGGPIVRRNTRKLSNYDVLKEIRRKSSDANAEEIESSDEPINPGGPIVRRNTRKLSNYDVMKEIRRNSADVNAEEIKLLDELIKEEHLDSKIEDTSQDLDMKKRKKFTKKKSNEKLVEDEPKEEPKRKKIVKKKTSANLDKAIEAITPKDTKKIPKISGTVEIESIPNLKLIVDKIQVEETVLTSPTAKKFKYNVIVEEIHSTEEQNNSKNKTENSKQEIGEQIDEKDIKTVLQKQNIGDKAKKGEGNKILTDKPEIGQLGTDKRTTNKLITSKPDKIVTGDTLNNTIVAEKISVSKTPTDKMLTGKTTSLQNEETLKNDKNVEQDKQKTLDKVVSRKSGDSVADKVEEEKQKNIGKILGKKTAVESPKDENRIADIEKQGRVETKLATSKIDGEKQKMTEKKTEKIEEDRTKKENKLKQFASKTDDEKQKEFDNILGKKTTDDINRKADKLETKKIQPNVNIPEQRNDNIDEVKEKPLNKPLGTNKINDEKQGTLDNILGKKITDNIARNTDKSETKRIQTNADILQQKDDKIGELKEKPFDRLLGTNRTKPVEISKTSADIRKKGLQKQNSLDEPSCDNFWDVIGKRETVYYRDRRKYLEEKRQEERKNLSWTPETKDENILGSRKIQKTKSSEQILKEKLDQLDEEMKDNSTKTRSDKLVTIDEKPKQNKDSQPGTKTLEDKLKQNKLEIENKKKLLEARRKALEMKTVTAQKGVLEVLDKPIPNKVIQSVIKENADDKKNIIVEDVKNKIGDSNKIVSTRGEIKAASNLNETKSTAKVGDCKVASTLTETDTTTKPDDSNACGTTEIDKTKNAVDVKLATAIKDGKKLGDVKDDKTQSNKTGATLLGKTGSKDETKVISSEIGKSKIDASNKQTKVGEPIIATKIKEDVKQNAQPMLKTKETTKTVIEAKVDKKLVKPIGKTATRSLQTIEDTIKQKLGNKEAPKLSVKQKSEEEADKKRIKLKKQSKSFEQPNRYTIRLTSVEIAAMRAEITEIKLEPLKSELDFIIQEEFNKILKPNEDLIVPTASQYRREKEETCSVQSPSDKTSSEQIPPNKLIPSETNILTPPEPKPRAKPKWFDECPVVIMATPRDLRKRGPIHRPKAAPQPVIQCASESESEDESDEDETSSDTDGGSDEYETNIVFEGNNPKNKWKSTSSNDSGFDSSAPGSPLNNRNRNDDCDVNCHKKCEKLTANLCGVNQKLIVEALTSVKKAGSTSTTNTSSSEPSISPAQNPAFTLEPMETSSAYSAYQRSGRVTPPATSIPRFRKYNVEDFCFLKVLGKGSFGKVLLAELRNTEYYYAVKCLKKDIVLEDDDVECTLIERKVLALGTKHPYLCHLFCTFQTESHLFFVMEYLNGGDLMFHIQMSGRFPEPRGRFYGAEIVSGLKFLHSKGIVYRDLKLDNILLDFNGHVRIADFGMCKLQIFLDRTADTFCGTPDYMAPEIIKGQHYNQGVDWWSFGVLLYEMLIGQSPFSGCDEDELFWSICNERPVIPGFLSKEASVILMMLLEKDSSKRLGTRYCPHGEIKDQPFFQPIDWDKLERRELEAPFKPRVQHPLDTQYFDKAFTAEKVKLTPIEKDILHSMDQTQFHGFSYTNPNATDK